VARLPRRHVPEPGRSLIEIVDDVLGSGLPRHEAVLDLRDDALAFRLQARRFRFRERVADSIAKLGGGSLLTATVAIIANGHGHEHAIMAGLATVTFFTVGTIYAASADYLASAWELEADRVGIAAAEIGGQRQ
jgi:hypothetical protein